MGALRPRQRLSADPGQLGELRGKTGLLASSAARQERARAEQVARAVGPAVARVGESETAAARDYRASVEAQCAADLTGVPSFSEAAGTAIGAVSAAKDDAGRATAWRAAQGDERVTSELSAFTAAVEKRFGEEGVRAILRSQHPGVTSFDGGASMPLEQRMALREVKRVGKGASVEGDEPCHPRTRGLGSTLMRFRLPASPVAVSLTVTSFEPRLRQNQP